MRHLNCANAGHCRRAPPRAFPATSDRRRSRYPVTARRSIGICGVSPMSVIPDRAITIVVRRRVPPERQQEFEAWAAEIIGAAATFPGHEGATLLPPALTGADDNLLIFRFDSAEHLAAWDMSDVKRQWLHRIADATIDVREQRATGL